MTALGDRHRLSRQAHALDPTRPPGRKTARKNPRREREIPDWRLSFVLPPGCLVSPGPVKGLPGVVVYELGRVEVVGKLRDQVVGKAALFIEQMVPGIQRWAGRMTRANLPAPALSGPSHRGDDDAVEFMVGKRVVLIAGHSMRVVVWAA